MINFNFDKKCSAVQLTKELKDAGFDVIGVSTQRNKTTVHLSDTEEKNPLAVVEAHNCPPEPEQVTDADRIADLELALADLVAAQSV